MEESLITHANSGEKRVKWPRRQQDRFVLLAECSAPASPFWAKVSMPGFDGARCWQWTGDLTTKGACVGKFVDAPADVRDRVRTLWVQPAEHEWLAVVAVDVPLNSVMAKATS